MCYSLLKWIALSGDSDSAGDCFVASLQLIWTGIRTPPGIASSLRSLQAQPAGGILGKFFASSVSASELSSTARSKILCGETGIRTPETLLEFTRFPGVPLQPLEHLSYVPTRGHLSKSATKLLQIIEIRKFFCNYF